MTITVWRWGWGGGMMGWETEMETGIGKDTPVRLTLSSTPAQPLKYPIMVNGEIRQVDITPALRGEVVDLGAKAGDEVRLLTVEELARWSRGYLESRAETLGPAMTVEPVDWAKRWGVEGRSDWIDDGLRRAAEAEWLRAARARNMTPEEYAAHCSRLGAQNVPDEEQWRRAAAQSAMAQNVFCVDPTERAFMPKMENVAAPVADAGLGMDVPLSMRGVALSRYIREGVPVVDRCGRCGAAVKENAYCACVTPEEIRKYDEACARPVTWAGVADLMVTGDKLNSLEAAHRDAEWEAKKASLLARKRRPWYTRLAATLRSLWTR